MSGDAVIDLDLHAMGAHAVLAETGTQAEALALHRALAASRIRGIRDLVPAARTVLVPFDPRETSGSAVRAWILHAAGGARSADAATGALVELPVRYDGPDLDDAAALLGRSPAELVARHRAAEWSVAFTGFAPGFGYLVSPDWPFDVPRLASPRTRVPAGSIGLAAGFTGAYPRDTPGGWRLIATTDAVLFDPASTSPVLLQPGARVRFVDAARSRERIAPTRRAPSAQRASGGGVPADAGARGIRVLEAGPLATVQDLGRDGRASLGIARSGALDRAALRRANRLVGNDEGAAGIEVTLGGLRATATADLWVAVTGAFGPATLDGRRLDRNRAVPWPSGAALHLDRFDAGARGYVAVRGGIVVPPVAGSRSTDVLAGLGPPPLAAQTALTVGPEPRDAVPAADLSPWGPPADEVLELELAPGARADWFTDAARAALFEAEWTVSADADRVGVRLDGPELTRGREGELPSEGMVPGALQVPPSGRPVVLLADGPVTGGYPVIAVVTDAGLDALAQARPGTRLRFRHARPTS